MEFFLCNDIRNISHEPGSIEVIHFWFVKPLIQKPLSKLPYGYLVNNWLQIRQGTHTVSRIRQRIPGVVGFIDFTRPHMDFRGAHILEYGTGWGALNAFLLSLFGAERVVASDYLPHLTFQVAQDYLQAISEELDVISKASGRSVSILKSEVDEISRAQTLPEMLERARIDYRAPLDLAATGFDDDSFDLVYSYAVKAHLPDVTLRDGASEAKRVLKSGGIVAHSIGLQDPYNKLNGGHLIDFLQYSESVWGFLNHNSVQHNNRVRASQHLSIYTDLGATVLSTTISLSSHICHVVGTSKRR